MNKAGMLYCKVRQYGAHYPAPAYLMAGSLDCRPASEMSCGAQARLFNTYSFENIVELG